MSIILGNTNSWTQSLPKSSARFFRLWAAACLMVLTPSSSHWMQSFPRMSLKEKIPSCLARRGK